MNPIDEAQQRGERLYEIRGKRERERERERVALVQVARDAALLVDALGKQEAQNALVCLLISLETLLNEAPGIFRDEALT